MDSAVKSSKVAYLQRFAGKRVEVFGNSPYLQRRVGLVESVSSYGFLELRDAEELYSIAVESIAAVVTQDEPERGEG